MTEPDQSALHDAPFAAIRAEIDDSLAFITGSKVLPRGQRHPRVGPTVRDYLADQIAWKFVGLLNGGIDEIKARIAFDADSGCCAKDGIDCAPCMTGHCRECSECVDYDDSRGDEDDAYYDIDED